MKIMSMVRLMNGAGLLLIPCAQSVFGNATGLIDPEARLSSTSVWLLDVPTRDQDNRP